MTTSTTIPTSIAEVTPRRAALIAGVGYLVIFVLAIFANFFVVNGLVESGDAAATARNIVDSEGLFRAGLVAFAIVFVIDVIVAWALFILFRNLSRDISLLAAWVVAPCACGAPDCARAGSAIASPTAAASIQVFMPFSCE